MKHLKIFTYGIIFVLICSAVGFAQTGSIAGTVADSTGAIVQGADMLRYETPARMLLAVRAAARGARTACPRLR